MLFGFNLNLAQFTLSLIVIYKFNVSFSIEDEFLSVCLLILSILNGPLLLEHFLLNCLLLFFLVRNDCLWMILPRQDVQSLLNLFSLFFGFFFFACQFFIGVKHPQLGIHLFLHYLLFHFLSLVHKLLFTFELSASGHEMCFLAPQIIRLHFKFPIHGSLDMLFFLSFTLCIDLCEPLRHFLPNLLWRFQIGKELLFIHLVFLG